MKKKKFYEYLLTILASISVAFMVVSVTTSQWARVDDNDDEGDYYYLIGLWHACEHGTNYTFCFKIQTGTCDIVANGLLISLVNNCLVMNALRCTSILSVICTCLALIHYLLAAFVFEGARFIGTIILIFALIVSIFSIGFGTQLLAKDWAANSLGYSYILAVMSSVLLCFAIALGLVIKCKPTLLYKDEMKRNHEDREVIE